MPRKGRKLKWLLGLVLLLIGVVLVQFWSERRKESRYDKTILLAAKRYQVDPALIKAIIWQESRFDAQARGKAGELGLMQIREEAAFEWADHERIHDFEHAHLLDPFRNIMAGTYYLSHVMKRYTHTDSPVTYALADYNAGRTHVLRWNKGAAKTNSSEFLAQMDYPGTRKYAENVIRRYGYYKADFNR